MHIVKKTKQYNFYNPIYIKIKMILYLSQLRLTDLMYFIKS